MPKKNPNLLQQTQQKLEPLADEADYGLDMQIPGIVQAWGLTVGISSVEDPKALTKMYGGLALRVARLLETLGITEVSEEARGNVNNRWSETVNHWVAVGNRVNALHDAWRYENHEDIVNLAQRVWAALEHRSPAITGQELKDVLK